MDLRSPTAIEAERALLGALLQDADALDALALVAPRDCYRPEHEALLALIVEMVDAGDAVDIVTVSERVQQRGATRYGGAAYVAELPEHAPSTTNAAHYAGVVALAARRRRTMRAAAQLAEAAADGNVPLDDAIAAFLAGLDDMAPASKERDGLIGEKIRLTNAERAVEPRVFPTGLPSLDQILGGGLSAGELCVVAGRPSWGKTSLCIGVLLEHALSGRPCGMVSLEMTRAQIVHRYVAQLAGVPIRYVARGGLDAGDEAAIADAHRQLADVPLHIEQPGGQTMADIARLIRRWKRDTGLDLVAIDYLGLVKRAPSKAPTHEQVGGIVKDLKRLALELDVAVVLAVQLNRAMVADRPRKAKGGDWWTRIPTPQLHHLAESGDVERDADKVLFPIPADVIREGGLYRELDAPRGAAVVLVAKNRQGPLGVAPCRWYGATASYHPEEPALQAIVGGQDRHYSDTEREEEP